MKKCINVVYTKEQKRKQYLPKGEACLLKRLLLDLPEDGVCLKVYSQEDISSIAFVMWVASKVRIDRLIVSSFAVGEKQASTLESLSRAGLLGDVQFLVGRIMRTNVRERDRRASTMQEIAQRNKWVVKVRDSHSKIVLMDTKLGKYVLETSSNLNENPREEQFSFEKDAGLFEYYENILVGGDAWD